MPSANTYSMEVVGPEIGEARVNRGAHQNEYRKHLTWFNMVLGGSKNRITYSTTSSLATHIAPGSGRQRNLPIRRGTDLVREGKKVVEVQDGRKGHPVVL